MATEERTKLKYTQTTIQIDTIHFGIHNLHITETVCYLFIICTPFFSSLQVILHGDDNDADMVFVSRSSIWRLFFSLHLFRHLLRILCSTFLLIVLSFSQVFCAAYNRNIHSCLVKDIENWMPGKKNTSIHTATRRTLSQTNFASWQFQFYERTKNIKSYCERAKCVCVSLCKRFAFSLHRFFSFHYLIHNWHTHRVKTNQPINARKKSTWNEPGRNEAKLKTMAHVHVWNISLKPECILNVYGIWPGKCVAI